METEQVPINWEEQKKTDFERILMPEDSYNFKVEKIEKQTNQKYGGKEGEKETQLKISLTVTDQNAGTANGKTLFHYVTPKISKGNTNKSGKVYSNSKLYDLLSDLGLKEKAKIDEGIKTIDGLQLFLSTNMAQKIIRANVKTVHPNTDQAYSKVQKILRFVVKVD
jgi:hypothetical protein